MKYSPTGLNDFTLAYTNAFIVSHDVRLSCTPLDECNFEGKCTFLSDDKKSGFVLSHNGELTNVFSTRKGRGDELMYYALAHGAKHLDCFDGYLVSFYSKHGFEEYNREANWDEGQPDVVYMHTID